jgi:hypothetical protein
VVVPTENLKNRKYFIPKDLGGQSTGGMGPI